MSTNNPSHWLEILNKYKDNENDYLRRELETSVEEIDSEEVRSRYSNQYEERRGESQYRKEALTTIMAGFIEGGGPLYEETDWEFRELFPLEEHDGESADILLGKPTDCKAILIVLLPERASPGSVVSRTEECIKSAKDHQNTFDIPYHKSEIKGAIVVNPPRDQETTSAVQQHGGIDLNDIFVWRVYDHEDSNDENDDIKILDNFDILDQNAEPTRPDSDLFQLLAEGAKISNGMGILPDFFLSSHHSIFLEHVVSHVVSIREDDDRAPITHFEKEEVENYIQDTLFKKNKQSEAREKCEFLLEIWEEMGIITSISEDRNDLDGEEFYRFDQPSSKGPDNIIKDISSEYRESTVDLMIRIEAMEAALEKFWDDVGKQSSLSDPF
jgi:hypothetical protein